MTANPNLTQLEESTLNWRKNLDEYPYAPSSYVWGKMDTGITKLKHAKPDPAYSRHEPTKMGNTPEIRKNPVKLGDNNYLVFYIEPYWYIEYNGETLDKKWMNFGVMARYLKNTLNPMININKWKKT